MFTATDHAHMARALRLARRGLATTTPNPRVGCVIVGTTGDIVGEGWHQRAGEPHAEVLALCQAATRAQGATAYVTLEPCNHHGRTPPCTEALLAAGIRRVIAAMQDPDPRVSGGGIAHLRSQGVAVESGLLENEARALNPGFIARLTRGRPWLTLKIAASLDGRTALGNGISQWITGTAARSDVQRQRARSCAILTGIGTVLQDDPRLTVREPDIGRQPLRVVADSRLRTPASARILAGGGTIIACASNTGEKASALAAAGAEVLPLPDGHGRVDLPALLADLGRRGINELLVEAGATLNGVLLEAGLVDEILLYCAPTLLGSDALGMFRFAPRTHMAQRTELFITSLDRIGQDIRIRATPR